MVNKYRFILFFLTFSLGNDFYDNSWALIIGINKYENVRPLDYAVKDAKAIKSLLIETCSFPERNITILLNEEANYISIKQSLSQITKNAAPNDRVIIFFAGHGETLDLPEGGELGFFMPWDGDITDLFSTSIPMDDLQKISSMSKAKHVLFLVDACYGGLAAVGSRGLNPSTPNFIEKILRDKARQIITAGGRGERVIEKAEWGHSAFTKNILRGLKEGFADMNLDGMITGEELGLFLKEKVSVDSDLRQTPQSRRFGSYEGEIVFNNVALTNKIKNDKNDKRNDGEIITLFSEQLKQSHELNKLLLEQIKKLDDENNNENDQMLKINTKFPEVSYNNSLINNSKISGILYHSFPGLGHLYSNDYKMGLFWSSIFTSSLISNYLIYNGTKEKQLEYDKSVSNYDSADRNFDLLKLQAQNSSKELSKSKTLFYTSCIVSSYIWYKSGSKYRRNININITGNRLLLSISI